MVGKTTRNEKKMNTTEDMEHKSGRCVEEEKLHLG